MLIEFVISNFRSIKDRLTFSMLPSERVKNENRKNALFPIEEYKNLNLLTLAGVWGRNSAGKSNIVRAFRALEWMVLNSHRLTRGDVLLANEFFVFDIQFEHKPTLFEIEFIAKDKKRYLYLIEFDKNEIYREELHYYVLSNSDKTTKRKLFVRRKDEDISFGDDFRGTKKLRIIPNVLFLSKAVAEDSPLLNPVFDFFKKSLHISDFSDGYIDILPRYFAKIADETVNDDMKKLNNALRNIDTGVLQLVSNKSDTLPKNFIIKEDLNEELNEDQRLRKNDLIETLKTEIKAVHRLFDGKQEVGIKEIPLSEESEGTRKFIAVFAALLQQIKEGNLFVIDEFDKSFHPILTKMLISLLTNPKINVNGAQLIITTHDVDLMDILDNDQICIAQKDYEGATELYTVSDIRGLRGDISVAKRYLRGELEGIPTINKSSIHQSLEVPYGEN